jgi:basic membrane protein A
MNYKYMKIKILSNVFILLAAVFLFTSCGAKTEARKDCQIRVGIVFDIGGKNDRSFNAAAWEGVQRAEKELPICLHDVEPGNPTVNRTGDACLCRKEF